MESEKVEEKWTDKTTVIRVMMLWVTEMVCGVNVTVDVRG